MELVERADFMEALDAEFKNASNGDGRCILLTGEAGIGKTSLVKNFYGKKEEVCKIYVGTCDALFTPRPLAPLYDILLQMQGDIPKNIASIHDRSELFTGFLHELKNQKETTLIVFEDIHWADEATMDFIKFFARRITRFHCLFVLTYRDTEIHSEHPLRNVLGQLPPHSFVRLQLTPLSRQAVEKMATPKGFIGDDVYTITGGNPFYVTEILASYSVCVPSNVKDSILSSYNRLDESTKGVWQVLSVLPTGLEIKYLEKLEPSSTATIHTGLELQIMVLRENSVFFKHELYRRTIEAALSPIRRIALNKKILDLFRESFELNSETERIIHHAKNANDYELVAHYAPLAAQQAAVIGSHTEAAKLYLTAIEYYQGDDKNILAEFYEAYAYECFLIGQLADAIIFSRKALHILKEKNDIEKIANCLRFLSWLSRFDGSKKMAESYALEAIEVLADEEPSLTKAMVHSNMGRLKMLWDEKDECLLYSKNAMRMAKQLNNEEVICHALINIGTMLSKLRATRKTGMKLLEQSMEIALKNNYEEQIGYSYANFATIAVVAKDYSLAKKMFEQGILFCEERDLDLAAKYLLIYKARLLLETGNWGEAFGIADNFIKNEEQSPIIKTGPRVVVATIQMRRGNGDALPLLLEAKEAAFQTGELARILPAMIALLEYEWITDQQLVEKVDLDYVLNATKHKGNIYENSAFGYWLLKARKQRLILSDYYEGYNVKDKLSALKGNHLMETIGLPLRTSPCTI
jgi:hypothetical protein